MEHRAKLNLGAPLIVGAVFGLIGGIFLAVGLGLHFFASNPDALTVSLVFMPLGAAFLAFGIAFLAAALSQKRRADRLIAGGRYVWGQISEFTCNYSVQVNGRHPHVAIVRYEDAAGVHIFRSRNLYRYPDASLVGQKVKVYIQNDQFKPYYVDMEPVLSRILEH